MKKVFISYHHAEPDTTVANAVASTIRERGHDPFIDVDIEIGERWAQRIDDEIRRSSVFVVLLSESSIYRDMVRTEVQIAYELYMTGVQNSENDQALPFQILPVRVGYEGDLPYDLAGYLGALQYILWRHDADTLDIASRIADAIDGKSIQENRTLNAAQSFDQRRPQPVADILLETGMLRDSPSQQLMKQMNLVAVLVEALRTFAGIVICPLLVTVTAAISGFSLYSYFHSIKRTSVLSIGKFCEEVEYRLNY
ncbi:MAG: toll/interleukin-1 receptor domain-containing protein [Granulosicoccus sp.]